MRHRRDICKEDVRSLGSGDFPVGMDYRKAT